MRVNGHARRIAAVTFAAAGLLLGACASGPSGRPVPLGGEAPVKFNTGRVTVVLTDFGGRPLRLALVGVENAGRVVGEEFFRTSAFSDGFGRVTFNGVPEQVRINVYHAETQGNYSREFEVPSSGITELRMLIETF